MPCAQEPESWELLENIEKLVEERGIRYVKTMKLRQAQFSDLIFDGTDNRVRGSEVRTKGIRCLSS